MPLEIDQVAFIKSAAFLRREFVSAENSRGNFESDSERLQEIRSRTIYLFDTDLIHLYCEPWNETAVRYGQIFPRAPSAEPSAREEWRHWVGEILGRYVLTKVRPSNLPVYQLHSHYQETKQNFEQNARHFALNAELRPVTSDIRQKQRLRGAAALFLYNANAPAVTGKSLLSDLILMLEQLSPVGLPTNQNEQRIQSWERFVRLNTETGGVFTAGHAGDHLRRLFPQNPELGNCFDVLREGENRTLTRDEQDIESKIISVMMGRINSVPNESNPQSDEKDAKAIASLYLINARLKELSQRSPWNDHPWRAVLITGAKRLTEACYEFDGETGKDGKPLPRLSAIDGIDPTLAGEFSQRAVRHLNAYVTEALLAPEERDTFIGWLDGLLGEAADKTKFQEKKLTQIVRSERSGGLSPKDPSFLKNQITENDFDRWEKTAKGAVSRDRIERLGLDRLAAEALRDKILKKYQSNNLAKFIEDVREQFKRTRDRAFVELSESGVLAVVQGAHFGERNPPDLSLDDMPYTNEIFKRLASKQPYPQEAFKKDLESIREDCFPGPDQEDPDGDDRQLIYLKFLVMGAAFGAANKWGVALAQAQHAISVIERSRRPGDKIAVRKRPDGTDMTMMSGREAYFLAASASRISAASPRDFERSRGFLEDAKTALKIEQEKNLQGRTTRIRFMCEALAIELGAYYFARWSAERGREQRPDLKFCDKEAQEVFSKLRIIMEGIENEVRLGAPFSSESANFRRVMGRISVSNLCVNIIQTCVIRAYRQSEGRTEAVPLPVSLQDLHQAVKLLNDLLFPAPGAKYEAIRESSLIAAYLRMGHLILGTPTDPRLRRIRSNDPSAHVAHYDKWRFERLEEFDSRISNMPFDEVQEMCFGPRVRSNK